MKLKPAWIILGVSLVVVTGRTLIAAQAGVSRDPRSSKTSGTREADPKLVEFARRESLLASLGVPDRNPFAAPVAKSQAAPSKPKKEEPAPVIPPRAVLLMQDGQSTLVQIEVNGQTSGWITTGGRFQGWTIESISAGGIEVTNGTDRFTLRRP